MIVPKYKAGDKVVYLGSSMSNMYSHFIGKIFTIKSVFSKNYGLIKYEVGDRTFAPVEDNLRLATPLDQLL